MSLPKVLIIGQPFNNDFGGGITQANLFGGWDKQKIAVVCTSHMFSNLNYDICDQYYVLGSEEHKWMFPFNFIQRKVTSGGVILKKPAETKKQDTAVSKPALRERVVNKFFYPFLEFIGVFHGISKITMSKKLCDWIDEFKPDIIYSQASSREGIQFCLLMEAYIKKPMIFHMMDDWPSTISQKGPFKNYWHKKIDQEFRVLLNSSSVLLSISDGMATEYNKRYNKSFITFHNPIEIQFWKSHQRKTYKLNGTTNVLYAGRIGTGIDTTLESMAAAIDKVNMELGISIQFTLQTKYKPEWVENYKCVKYQSLVAYNQLPKVFAEADFLYLPYDFSDDSIKFIRYSMPTKAPEYMVSGTPIIIFAPEETALVMDAKQNNWAKVITENDINKLTGAIKEMYTSESERTQIASNAIAIAERKFDSNKVRDNFREIILSAAVTA